MQLDVVVAFFPLGLLARLTRSGLQFPEPLYQSIVIYLLLAIGLKGGIALNEHASMMLLPQAAAVIAFGLLLPLLAFPLLFYVGQLSRQDSASIAAHYGSVSIGTYAVAVAFLDSHQIAYEPWFPLFVALLEMPAIAVGIWLASDALKTTGMLEWLHETFLNQGVLLLLGGLLVGWWAGDRAERLMPFFNELFHGVLALFLLKMGMTTGERLGAMRSTGSFLVSFGVFMPLLGAGLGTLLAMAIGLSLGGAILLATLGASASYIAVPSVMAIAVPGANHGMAIAVSLAVTFPFNVVVGIPLYTALIQRIYG